MRYERRSTRCGRCGLPTRLVRNPYYRVGLAIHQFFRVCPTCDTLQFVKPDEAPAVLATWDPNATDESPQPPPRETPLRRSRWRSVWRFVSRANG